MLLPQHLEHLRASGLTDATIAAAQLRSVTDPVEAGKLLNWTGQGPVPAIALPNIGFDGAPNITYLRPDFPRQKGDRYLKYETPVGQPPRPYFSPGFAAQVADPKRLVVFTEGIKKALAVWQAGVPAISAPGVTCWHDIEHKRATGEWRLNKEVAAVALRGRPCAIAFDSDTTTNRDVQVAEARLARMLLEAGATVRLVRVPCDSPGKVGIDDWLAARSDPARDLAALLEGALEANPSERIKDLKKTEVWQLVNDDAPFLASLYAASDLAFAFVASELRGRIPRDVLRRATVEFGKQAKLVVDLSSTASPEDEERAAQYLRDPDPVPRFLDAVGRAGLVGERQAATFVLLAAISRLLPNPINLILRGPSASGKNQLCRYVLSFFPEDDVLWVSTLSEQALRYLDEPGALKHKVLVLDEVGGGDRALYDLRQLTSEGRITLLVPERSAHGNIATVQRVVEGPLCVITTTTRFLIDDDAGGRKDSKGDENETRLLEVAVDASREQNEAVVREIFLSEIEDRPDVTAERRAWRVALAMLAVPARAKFVRYEQRHIERLFGCVDPRNTRARRDAHKVTSLMKSYAMLHQQQRVSDDRGRIVVTDEDVDSIVILARVFRETVSPALAKQADILRRAFGHAQFTSAGAEERLGVSRSQRKRTMAALVAEDLVAVVKDGGPGKASVYQFASAHSEDGPTGPSTAEGAPDDGVGPPRPKGEWADYSPTAPRESAQTGPPGRGGEVIDKEQEEQSDLWDLPKGGQP